MNCVEFFRSSCLRYPRRPALWFRGKVVTFEELYDLTSRAQNYCQSLCIEKGDTILLLDYPGPRLYAFILGLLGLGANVIFVEPWMKAKKINSVIDAIGPKYFIKNTMGTLWSFRSQSVRKIPHRVSVAPFKNYPKGDLRVVPMDEDSEAITTFTTGTTGVPKGVPRRQGYLVSQFKTINRHLKIDQHEGMDLCIFANFVLANLAAGRGSILIHRQWKERELRRVSQLQGELRPSTVTCGPAFLLRLIKSQTDFSTLESFHVGGALTDVGIFEQGFAKWPHAEWSHVYGGSEAEPVAFCDARESVKKSKERGFFQALFLGKPVEEIQYQNEEDSVWVSGVHVCPLYRCNEAENKKNKKVDGQKRVWHRMGDRILIDEEGWWYQGRAHQKREDFLLEQQVYSTVGSSKSFVTRDGEGKRCLWGEGLNKDRLGDWAGKFDKIMKVKIARDVRHRARIDREKSIGGRA